MTELKFTTWALEQVKTRGPGTGLGEMNLQALIDALRAVRRGTGQVFGMSATNFEPEGQALLDAALIEQLVAWKQSFVNEPASELALSEAVAPLGIEALKMTRRVPLQCDPLGTRDGLSAEWLSILSRLDEAKAGTREVNLKAVEADADHPQTVTFGEADEQALYVYALRFESRLRVPFPRELAAFFSTANGVFVDGDPLLAAVSQWSDEDAGLRIGCGGYMQGSLVLKGSSKKLLAAKVVDADDDGEVRAKYANFAAFAEALLGPAK